MGVLPMNTTAMTKKGNAYNYFKVFFWGFQAFVLVVFGIEVVAYYTPDVQEIIATILEHLKGSSFDDSAGMDYLVN